MANFYLSEVLGIDFAGIPFGLLRAYFEAGIEDMKHTFYGKEDEIEDWASGGWAGRAELMRKYFSADDGEPYQIMALMNFDKLCKGFFTREAAELATALARKSAA